MMKRRAASSSDGVNTRDVGDEHACRRAARARCSRSGCAGLRRARRTRTRRCPGRSRTARIGLPSTMQRGRRGRAAAGERRKAPHQRLRRLRRARIEVGRRPLELPQPVIDPRIHLQDVDVRLDERDGGQKPLPLQSVPVQILRRERSRWRRASRRGGTAPARRPGRIMASPMSATKNSSRHNTRTRPAMRARDDLEGTRAVLDAAELLVHIAHESIEVRRARAARRRARRRRHPSAASCRGRRRPTDTARACALRPALVVPRRRAQPSSRAARRRRCVGERVEPRRPRPAARGRIAAGARPTSDRHRAPTVSGSSRAAVERSRGSGSSGPNRLRASPR